MRHPYDQALSSLRESGGTFNDYMELHEFFASSKATLADFRHRAMLHHAGGICLLQQVFGKTLTLSSGRGIPTRWLGEQHVREDLGYISSFADWARAMRPDPGRAARRRLKRRSSPWQQPCPSRTGHSISFWKLLPMHPASRFFVPQHACSTRSFSRIRVRGQRAGNSIARC